MNWFLENWQGIVGGGSITTVVTFIANRKNNKADVLLKFENIYNSLADNLKEDRDAYKLEISDFKNEIKELRQEQRDLQKQLNEINLAYAKEIEKSQNWEKLHRELLDKYNDLERKHNELQCEFDAYKMKHK